MLCAISEHLSQPAGLSQLRFSALDTAYSSTRFQHVKHMSHHESHELYIYIVKSLNISQVMPTMETGILVFLNAKNTREQHAFLLSITAVQKG